MVGSGGLFVPNKARKAANAWPPREVSGSVGPKGDTYNNALADSVTGCLHEACGDLPPADLETAYYRQNVALAEVGQTAT